MFPLGAMLLAGQRTQGWDEWWAGAATESGAMGPRWAWLSAAGVRGRAIPTRPCSSRRCLVCHHLAHHHLPPPLLAPLLVLPLPLLRPHCCQVLSSDPSERGWEWGAFDTPAWNISEQIIIVNLGKLFLMTVICVTVTPTDSEMTVHCTQPAVQTHSKTLKNVKAKGLFLRTNTMHLLNLTSCKQWDYTQWLKGNMCRIIPFLHSIEVIVTNVSISS